MDHNSKEDRTKCRVKQQLLSTAYYTGEFWAIQTDVSLYAGACCRVTREVI